MRIMKELLGSYPLIRNTKPDTKSIVVMILGNTCSGIRLSIILPTYAEPAAIAPKLTPIYKTRKVSRSLEP